ncbi:hypothetical protein Tco_1100003 [Tanacetum coccineum]
MIQNEFITLSLAQFSQILKIPYNGQAIFKNEWDLSTHSFFQENEGPYYTGLPTPDEIHQFLRFERVDSNCTIKNKFVTLTPNQVLTKEVREDLKRWEELILENVFSLGGHRDHLPACLSHILYYILVEQQYNLAYFFVKRIKSAKATPKSHLPYGISKPTRRPRSDHGIPKACYSISSSSTHHFGSSSHQEDNDNDEGTSRASTPSPNSYLNVISPLTHQTYNIPTSSEQTDRLLFERQTTLLNQTQQIHEEVSGGFKSFRKALK